MTRPKEELGRLPERLRGTGFETVHQKTVAVIVIVEDPPQVLPGRQAAVPLQLGRNGSPVDGCDPITPFFNSIDPKPVIESLDPETE